MPFSIRIPHSTFRNIFPAPIKAVNIRAGHSPAQMDSKELQRIFVLANEFKEGDLLVGGTRDEHVRAEARCTLGSLRLGDIARSPFVEDGVSQALAGGVDRSLAAKVSHMTVAEMKAAL